MLRAANQNVLTSLFGRTTTLLNQSTWYFALSTTTVTTPATGSPFTEVSGGGYGRASYGNSGSDWTLSTDDMMNANTVSWPIASSAWGTILAIGLYTAPSGGTLILAGNVGPPGIPVAIYDSLYMAAGGFKVTFTSF